MDLLDLMPEQVTIEPYSASGGLYDPRSWGAAVTYRARVEQVTNQVLDAQGDQRLSQATVYIGYKVGAGGAISPVDGTEGFTVHDRVTLPVHYQPREPQIIAVESDNDERGFACWVLRT